MKHWIAVHTWNSEDDKLKFEKEIAPSLLESEEKWVEIVSELEGADLQQTLGWRRRLFLLSLASGERTARFRHARRRRFGRVFSYRGL